MKNVLVVEDSLDTQNLIRLALEPAYQVMCLEQVGQVQQVLKARKFDLIILDLELPDGTAFPTISEIRADERYTTTPVVVLSAHQSLEEKLLCFDLGATDYIVKPVDWRELRARIVSKGHIIDQAASQSLQMENLLIKKDSHEVYVRSLSSTWDRVHVTPTEYRILICLIENQGSPLVRQILVERACGEGVHVTMRAIDAHISLLRKKLGPAGEHIQTIYGQGYVYMAKAK